MFCTDISGFPVPYLLNDCLTLLCFGKDATHYCASGEMLIDQLVFQTLSMNICNPSIARSRRCLRRTLSSPLSNSRPPSPQSASTPVTPAGQNPPQQSLPSGAPSATYGETPLPSPRTAGPSATLTPSRRLKRPSSATRAARATLLPKWRRSAPSMGHGSRLWRRRRRRGGHFRK